MDWLGLLYSILRLCVVPLLGVLTTYIVKYFKAKEIEINNRLDNETIKKYVLMLSETISECVTATTQTYVDSLKAQGKFDEAAQKIAFNKSYEAVMTILSKEAKEYLATIYGDLQTYVANRIEAEIKIQK